MGSAPVRIIIVDEFTLKPSLDIDGPLELLVLVFGDLLHQPVDFD